MSNEHARGLLESFGAMAADPQKRKVLVKENNFLSTLVYLMDDKDEVVVSGVLDILHQISDTEAIRRKLALSQEVTMGLKCMADDNKVRNPALANRATLLHQRLSIATMLRERRNQAHPPPPDGKGSKVPHTPGKFASIPIRLELKGAVTGRARKALEAGLVDVRGVVSFLVDPASSRVTVRVKPGIANTEELFKAVAKAGWGLENVRMFGPRGNEIKPACKAEENQQPVAKENLPGPAEAAAIPDYLPEEDSPVKPVQDNAVAVRGLKENACVWLSSATSFFQRSFYW